MNNGNYWVWSEALKNYQIYYKTSGQGSQHVLLIHGYGSHTCTWNDLIPILTSSGYKVWALDLLGFGYSDKPLDFKYGLKPYLRQINSFMNDLGISNAHLISHSMGGAVALGLAAYHEDLVKSLTLISPMAYPIQLPLGFRIAKEFPWLVKPFCGLAFIRSLRKNLVKNIKVACTPQKIAEAAEPYFLPNGPDAAFKILGHFDHQLFIELIQTYPQIKKPNLILWGREDSLIPVSHSDLLKNDLPQATVDIIEQCGHIPHEEYPEEVGNKILNFLNKQAYG